VAQLTGFEGVNRFIDEATCYILEFENGFKIYHSGDTSLMGDMKYILGDYYKPDEEFQVSSTILALN
jgi:L-ascorbate metabolism protein UlaG (beta-lactamase superfamily)